MRSFLDIPPVAAIPVEAAGILARIDQARGREDLHRMQAPQVLERLAAHARFESITASNAIEGVIVDDDRALAIVRAPEGTSHADRTEREFAGYRDASDYLVSKETEPASVPLVLHLHRLLMRHTDDSAAGAFKTSDNIIGRRHADGRVTKIFTAVAAGEPGKADQDNGHGLQSFPGERAAAFRRREAGNEATAARAAWLSTELRVRACGRPRRRRRSTGRPRIRSGRFRGCPAEPAERAESERAGPAAWRRGLRHDRRSPRRTAGAARA